MSNLPIVAGVEIPVDEEGRYNLNVLHRAHEAMAGFEQPNKAPAQWLRTSQAQEFVLEVKNETMQNCIVSTMGRNGGTFAHELIAVEYAGWISPKFRILVNQTFIDYRMGKIASQPSVPMSQTEIIFNIAKAAMEMEQQQKRMREEQDRINESHAKLANVSRVLSNRQSVVEEKLNGAMTEIDRKILASKDESLDKIYTPTQIARKITTKTGNRGMSARKMMLIAEELGFIEAVTDDHENLLCWKLTPEGQLYGWQRRIESTGRYTSPTWSETVMEPITDYFHSRPTKHLRKPSLKKQPTSWNLAGLLH